MSLIALNHPRTHSLTFYTKRKRYDHISLISTARAKDDHDRFDDKLTKAQLDEDDTYVDEHYIYTNLLNLTSQKT